MPHLAHLEKVPASWNVWHSVIKGTSVGLAATWRACRRLRRVVGVDHCLVWNYVGGPVFGTVHHVFVWMALGSHLARLGNHILWRECHVNSMSAGWYWIRSLTWCTSHLWQDGEGLLTSSTVPWPLLVGCPGFLTWLGWETCPEGGETEKRKEKSEPRPNARVSRGHSVSSDLATTLVKTWNAQGSPPGSAGKPTWRKRDSETYGTNIMH